MKLQGQGQCERCKRNINGEAGTIVWSLGETLVEGLYCEHCMDRVMRVIVCPEKDEHWGGRVQAGRGYRKATRSRRCTRTGCCLGISRKRSASRSKRCKTLFTMKEREGN